MAGKRNKNLPHEISSDMDLPNADLESSNDDGQAASITYTIACASS